MKKFIAILCAAAMVLTLAACGAKRNTEYAGQTVTGKVTAIDGTSVTLALGESSGSGAPSGGDGQQPPEMPDGSSQTDGQPTGMPPEKPDGSDDSGQSGGQEPPAKPDGDSSQQPTGTPPEKPDGDSDQQGGTPPEMPDGSSQQGGFTESGETVTVDISKATVTKNGESASASDLAAGDVVQVTFDKKGVATAVVIGSQSGFGGGGTTNASNLTVNTSGNSSAAIRSDRGGGTVNVSGGSYTSNGYNSPAVYSTADITVENATLTANNSEALVIEGKNSITLENCTVTGNMSDTKGTSSDENVHNVMIYQSMSGDADVGTSTFSMTGGSLTAKNGDMIYVTNTHCVLTLSGVTLKNEDSDGALLRVVGNSASHGWGTAGSNGAQVEFTADGQVLTGDIVVDTISTLTMTLKNGSSFTGTVNIVENAQGGTAVSNNAVVTVESGCTWTLTGNCTLTSLTNNGTINFNGYTITLADGTVLK